MVILYIVINYEQLLSIVKLIYLLFLMEFSSNPISGDFRYIRL